MSSALNVVIPKGATECQTCGYLGAPGKEFHSYESCILYILQTNPDRLTVEMRHYIFEAGKRAMQERVRAKEVPDW